jgi:hypothetical protein
MSTYTAFYLNRAARIKEYELLEISHPDFTKTYYIVRNKVGGVSATIDTGTKTFDWYPLRITSKGTRSDMDYALQIGLGDLGSIVSTELDAVAAADGWGTKPIVRYWTFSSDNLATPIFGPISLQVIEFPQTQEGSNFVAGAKALNSNRTGELYLPSRFPMLRGVMG